MSLIGFISLITIGCGSVRAGLPTTVFGPNSYATDDSLFSKAQKVLTYRMFTWTDWLTDRDLLIGYGDKAHDYEFFRLNTATGKRQPIRELNRNFMIWNHDHFTISPNGKYAAWREPEQSIVVVSLDGSMFVRRWEDPSDKHNDIEWLGDSRHWFIDERTHREDKDDWNVEVFDVFNPAWSQPLKLTKHLLGDILHTTPHGTIFSQMDAVDQENTDEIIITETRLLPKPRLIQQFKIDTRKKGKLCSLSFSPSGERIVWTFGRGQNETGKNIRDIWFSDKRGTHWSQLGSIPVNSADDEEDGVTAHWSPGGSFLSLEGKEDMWRLPVSQTSMKLAAGGPEAEKKTWSSHVQTKLVKFGPPFVGTQRPTISSKPSVAVNTKLLKAAEAGDITSIRGLIQKGANVNARDSEGLTPLLRAELSRNLPACKVLIEAGADVNATGNDGETPLWASADDSTPELAKLLLAHGARVNPRHKASLSALVFAAERGHLEIIKLLVAHGVDLKTQGQDAIGQAVFKGRIDVVRYLIKCGVSINAPRWDTGSYPGHMDTGWSLLMIAIKRDHSDVAELLIKSGTNVHVKSRKGMTALKVARYFGDDRIVRLLKGAGAKK